jgi:single-stranded-DNA-specific exonuclease
MSAGTGKASDALPGHGAVDPALEPFLDVQTSLTGRRWVTRVCDPQLIRTLMLGHGLSEPLARALAARGVTPADAAEFLEPTLRALFPDPSSFAEMDKAAGLLVDAVEDGRPCVVFADYDVDGATSAALLVRWFRALGRTLEIYVPDREREGYGPTPAVFRKLKSDGAALVITVDCGAAAEVALATAVEIDLPVVVIDHHMMRATAPPAAALVNPNRADCRSGQGNLAAAGVVFVLLAALNREARRRGLFAGERREPDLRQWLDLAALGAVCDVTRLTGFNRALTAQGLKVLSSWRNPGLRALADVAMTGGEATTFHAGFVLGPRINAGGRIGRADVGARLLSTDDPEEARLLAAELDGFNVLRKEIEAETLAEAERQLAAAGDCPVLIARGEGWRPGVVGIVAGRLRERYRRPVIIIGIDPETGIGKGSGRSQPGVNLGRGIQAAFDSGLLLSGGGHAMAAGLTVEAARIDELRRFLEDCLGEETRRATEADAVEIDALLTPGGADRGLWNDFNRLAPFGPGNPEPLFALADVRPLRAMVMRGGHVRCELTDVRGARLKAVAWRAADTELGERLLGGEQSLHVVGRLKPDDWQGREGVQLEIEDVADPRRR